MAGVPFGVASPRSPFASTPTMLGDPEQREEGIVRQHLLGKGGYGEVWLVKYVGRLEACKYLTRGSGDQRKRAIREAFNARKNKHPNIVDVFGIDEVDGQSVLRMEYVPGRDLGKVIDEDGALPVDALVSLAVQVADALACAHEQGVVHQDVKPSNLLLRENGKEVVVTDFGIAGILRAGDETGLLGPGTSPYFVSPQVHQTRQGNTANADIWSLGVTLYHLATGGFPFPFDQMEPRLAVRELVIDPCPKWPHVPPEFWGLVGRMLTEDREQAFGSMAAVRQELEQYQKTLLCPGCGNRAPLDAVQEQCPAVACRSPLVAALKAGILARRVAETALCECRFEESAQAFLTAAAELAKAGSPVAACMRSLAEGIQDLDAEHGRLTRGARELLDANRLVACVRAVQEARKRFSRSPALREIRAEARARIVELYSGLEARVAEAVKERRFEEARESVNRVDQIRGDPVARRELELAIGREPEGFDRLYRKVEEKGELFFSLTSKAQEQIGRFRFQEARDIYARLEAEFPDPEHLDMITRLAEAREALPRATAVADDLLQDLVTDPQRISQSERVPLAEISAAAQRLSEFFPAETYPSIERVRRTGELADQAAQGLQAYVADRQREAEGLRQASRFGAERRVLALAQGVLERADIFDQAVREAVASRLRELEVLLERARLRYTEGREALERLEFAKAVALFNEVTTLAPLENSDLAELQRQALESKTRVADLGEQVSRALGEVEGGIAAGRLTLEETLQTLRSAEELLANCEESLREKYLKDTATALWRLVQAQSQLLDPKRGAEVPDVAGFLAQNLLPLASALPAARWADALRVSSELRTEFCTLFQHVVARITGEPEARLAGLEAVAERVAALEPILSACPAPRLSVHPTAALAKAMAGAVGEVDGRRRHAALERAKRRIEGFRAACPAESLRELERANETLKLQGMNLKLKGLVLRTAKSPGIAWSVAVLVLVGGIWLAWQRHRDGRNYVIDQVSEFDSWVEILQAKMVPGDVLTLPTTPGEADDAAGKLEEKHLVPYARKLLQNATIGLGDPNAGGSLLVFVLERLGEFSSLNKNGVIEALINRLESLREPLAELKWDSVKPDEGQDLPDSLRKDLEGYCAAEFRRACFEKMCWASEKARRGDDDMAPELFVKTLDGLIEQLQSLPPLERLKDLTEGYPVQQAIIEAINMVVPVGS